MKSVIAMAVLAAASLGVSANAAVLSSTGFEASQGYVAGSLTGQAGGIWSNADFGNPGLFSVAFDATRAAAGTGYVNAPTTAWPNSGTPQRYSWIDQAPVSTGIVRASTSVYVGAGTGSAVSAGGIQLYVAGGAFLGAGLWLQSDGVLVAARDDGSGTGASATIGLGAATLVGGYHTFEVSLDYSIGQFSVSVDGISQDSVLDSLAFARTFNTSRAFSDADLFGIKFAGTGGSDIRFDNYLVETVIPAPASAALLGLSGLVAARRRRA